LILSTLLDAASLPRLGEAVVLVSSGKVEDDNPAHGDLWCLALEWHILGDATILFSSGDLTNCTFEVDDFLRFSVGGFGALTADDIRFTSNDFFTFTLLEVVCLLLC